MLAVSHWIDACRQQFAALLVALSGLCEGHIRVDTQRNHLFLSPWQYFRRQYFPALLTHRYRPPLSDNLRGFSVGLARRTAVSIRGVGYLEMGVSRPYPQIYPLIPPAAGAF